MNKITSLSLMACALVIGFATAAHAAYTGPAGSHITYTIGGPAIAGTDVNLQALTASQSVRYHTYTLPNIGKLKTQNAAIVKGDDTWGEIQNKRPAGLGLNDHYLAVYGATRWDDPGKATFTLNKNTNFNTVSFTWGTVDTYNYLTIVDKKKNQYTISGKDLIAKASLTQGVSSTYFSLTDLDGIYKVILSSCKNAFEVANITFSNVPLPAALPMFGAALIGLAAARRRKAQVA